MRDDFIKKIGIRADDTPSSGMGHLMRSMSLGKALKKAGAEVFFICSHSGVEELLASNGFKSVMLESTGLNEADEILRIALRKQLDAVIIDSYKVNKNYFDILKKSHAIIAYIDDVNLFNYPVDILINGNITGVRMDYVAGQENEIMLLGPRYNLIREEFRGAPRKIIKKRAEEIMITTGGSDPLDSTWGLCNEILRKNELDNIKVNVIIGGYFKNIERLRKLAENHSNIILHEKVGKMSEIIQRSDMALCAAGSTLYELSACGTPAIAFIIADNQVQVAEEMDKEGYIENTGWYSPATAKNIIGRAIELIGNYEMRAEYSNRMQNLVDGKGAERVAEEILKARISTNRIIEGGGKS